MPAITSLDLSNAKLDVDHIAAIANSPVDIATDRLGHTKLTVQGAVKSLASFTPRGARTTGTTYNIKDIYIEAGIAYLVVVQSFVSVSLSADISSGKVVVYQRPVSVVSARDYGAVLNGTADDSSAIITANTVAGGGELRIDGVANIVSHVTITAIIQDTLAQIFTPTSNVTIDNGQAIRPEWFGIAAGNIRHAVDSLPTRGGVIMLSEAIYPPSYDTATGGMFDNRGGSPGVDYMVKPNVSIQGTRLPYYAEGGGSLLGGTVIQGTFYVSSEAHGFHADKLGVDAGIDVVNALYSGDVNKDAFCILQTNKATPVYGKGMHIGSVRGLASGTASLGHACLFEAMTGAHIDFAEGRSGLHGVVIKSNRITAGTLIGRGNHGEDVIFKSDSYANMYEVQVDNVLSESLTAGVVENGYGVLIQAPTAGGGTIQIGNLFSAYKKKGLSIQGGGFFQLSDISISSIIIAQAENAMEFLGGFNRLRIGSAVIKGTTNVPLFVESLVNSKDNRVESLMIDGGVNGVYVAGKISIGNLALKNLGTFGVEYVTSAARVNLDSYDLTSVPEFWNATQPLLNGWVSSGGGNSFYLDAVSGNVRLSGLVTSGSNSTITTLPSNIRPAQAQRFGCLGFDGTNYKTIEVIITTDGNVIASNYTQAPNYISLNNCTWPMPF